MKPADGKLIDILPVEDDAADVRLTREALKGATVLGEIKGDPAPKHIPVVMFTGSKAEADIATAFELQANGYVIKPVELDQFLKAVRSMEGFLVGIVDTPPATEHDAT